MDTTNYTLVEQELCNSLHKFTTPITPITPTKWYKVKYQRKIDFQKETVAKLRQWLTLPVVFETVANPNPTL